MTGRKDFEEVLNVSIVFIVFSSKHDACFSAQDKLMYLFMVFWKLAGIPICSQAPSYKVGT